MKKFIVMKGNNLTWEDIFSEEKEKPEDQEPLFAGPEAKEPLVPGVEPGKKTDASGIG